MRALVQLFGLAVVVAVVAVFLFLRQMTGMGGTAPDSGPLIGPVLGILGPVALMGLHCLVLRYAEPPRVDRWVVGAMVAMAVFSLAAIQPATWKATLGYAVAAFLILVICGMIVTAGRRT